MTTIQGKNFIGYSLSALATKTFRSYVPAQDNYLEETFHPATPDEVEQTMALAEKAFDTYASLPASQRADFLVAITEEIMALGDALLERAHLETGLPMPRLQGERGRTVNQLLQFADLIREGSWVEARIDTALPDRAPAPKPDLRKMLIPIGPIVVFGSSNFPFAYSVAGVDTGPALAAGNPVIVKAHPAHPGVSDLTAQAIVKAAQRTGMPEGVFSMLYDDGHEVGTALVQHPATKAVGFTGSMKGGMALYKMAMERDEPIPVFAEMGSVNPVVILPKALESRTESLAKTLAGSVTLGAGQFCTNPGLVFTVQSPALAQFEASFQQEIAGVASATMLTAGICQNYRSLRDEAVAHEGVKILHRSEAEANHSNQAEATLARVDAKTFIDNPTLQEEVFGPFSLLVVCEDTEELYTALALLKGQLTTSLMADAEEAAQYPQLLRLLTRRAGRFIMNGVPTGVEVCAAMHHGGPFPSTTDSRFTSVGRDAILRFVRPQSFQDWDNSLLPAELQNENPRGIWRLVNNDWTQAHV
ncbi:aldehyde dehydrogenase (NADP(+)) [Rhabdobacter roseus]|uniref:NADP-dependent aldehyde dehydrogenase n=1 Tax=Rhabdobacter roseus TaxID=1655419 RepID=A0A840U206_9BACT|nr:aldehyde dehydrogenase (NADP(+)) [Rhabdobacter roseus]MBB5285869.1 NADP-dependent aldehyde dehydrogenase [Rhabdobacter roseus]